jgi:exopolyphosphatase/guanosine-5'-triphosphate,3'-diphosphate pyrophosphatase
MQWSTTSKTGETSSEAAMRPQVMFPLRVAAIDVGSNAIRFVAAEFSDREHYTELEKDRAALRLGQDAFRSGALAQTTIEAAVEAVGRFRRRLDSLGVCHYRAVATSAVRESQNSGELIERVRLESGVHLDTITGGEEARLVWLAIRSRVSLGKGKWVLIDLGGGSVEVSLVDEARIHWTESHGMGSVRMLELFASAGGSPDQFRQLVEEYASRLHLPGIATEASLAGTIATGGNIEALAKLAGCQPGANGVTVLPIKVLHAVSAQLAASTYDERVQQLGLREDRADVIVPAAAVYERLARLAGAEQIVIPNAGVKEGLLIDLVDELTAPRTCGRNRTSRRC